MEEEDEAETIAEINVGGTNDHADDPDVNKDGGDVEGDCDGDGDGDDGGMLANELEFLGCSWQIALGWIRSGFSNRSGVQSVWEEKISYGNSRCNNHEQASEYCEVLIALVFYFHMGMGKIHRREEGNPTLS